VEREEENTGPSAGPSRGRGGEGGRGGRGRGGRGGGGDGGDNTARDRELKDKNKAHRGNHDRKRGHDRRWPALDNPRGLYLFAILFMPSNACPCILQILGKDLITPTTI